MEERDILCWTHITWDKGRSIMMCKNNITNLFLSLELECLSLSLRCLSLLWRSFSRSLSLSFDLWSLDELLCSLSFSLEDDEDDFLSSLLLLCLSRSLLSLSLCLSLSLRCLSLSRSLSLLLCSRSPRSLFFSLRSLSLLDDLCELLWFLLLETLSLLSL